MQVTFPVGEHKRTLMILKSGQSVYALTGVHVDTTNLQVPHHVKPPFTFELYENEECVYSAEYDGNGELVDALVYPVDSEDPVEEVDDTVPNLIEESVGTKVELTDDVSVDS